MFRFLSILVHLGFALAFVLPAHAQKLSDSITEIRIEAIQSNSVQIQKVVGSDILQGADAQRFVAKWNSLKREPGGNDCSPRPAYRLWFYQNKAKLKRCVAICFECHTIFLLDSDSPDHLEDDYLFEDSSSAHDLRKILAHLFPGHDPKS